jgi:hypothetical protein
MNGTKQIEDFAKRIRASGRIHYADVRRLRRDVLPHGVIERAQAETLVALDREIERVDATFRSYLIDEIVRFVVWDDRPTGRFDENKTAWLCGVLCRERITQTGAAIAAAVVDESETEIPDLMAIARKRRPRVLFDTDADDTAHELRDSAGNVENDLILEKASDCGSLNVA